ncbi:MAG: Myo-inosose-2 dehydratase [Bacteroidota bacterium]|jgi:inosose dehydratase
MIKRRDFLKSSALIAGTPFLANIMSAKNPSTQLAVSSITWGGNDLQAIKEIASLGYKGIQLRANTYKEFGDRPEVLAKALKDAGLKLVMYSSGNVEIAKEKRAASIEQHVNHAKFVKALGGPAIQLTNGLRREQPNPSKEDLQELAKVMNEIGDQCAEFGMMAAYHNHMHQWGETPWEVDILIKEMNNKNLRLELDVAHYFQGGGDPAKAVRDYKDYLYAVHLKDVRRPHPKRPNEDGSYQFVELGEGLVNLEEVFQELNNLKFKGWGIVELDGVPDQSKSPLECHKISKDFLSKDIGYKF